MAATATRIHRLLQGKPARLKEALPARCSQELVSWVQSSLPLELQSVHSM